MPLLHRRKRSTSVEAVGPSTSTTSLTISAPAKMQPSTSGSSSRQRRTSADPPTLPTLTRATLNHMRTGSIPVMSSSGVMSTALSTPMPGSSKGKEREKERGRERRKDKDKRSEDGHAVSKASSSKGKERDMGGPVETSMPPLYARFAKGASVERPVPVEEPRRERTQSHRTAAEVEEKQRRREERKRREERERIDNARVVEMKPESPLETLERRAHRDAERERQRDQERERERDREARRREKERQAMEREVARAGEREERRRRRREEREAEAQRAKDAAWAHAQEEEAREREEQARAEDERRRDESRRKEEEDRMRQEEDQRRHEEARRRHEEEMRQQEEARRRHEEAQMQYEAEKRRHEDVQRQHEEAQRQHEQRMRQYEAELQRQRERTTSLQSQAASANSHDVNPSKRTSSRAPAPYRAPSSAPSNPSSVSGPTLSFPHADPSHPPDYAPLVAHHAHHQHSSSLNTPVYAYPPAPGAQVQPTLSLRPSRSFENARSRRPSHTGPPLSPSARHNERTYAHGHGYASGLGHHRSVSSGASVAGASVRSHGLPTPPSSASSAIGQPSRPGSVQAQPLAQNVHQVAAAAPAATTTATATATATAGGSQQQVAKSHSKTSVDKPLPTPVVPVATPVASSPPAPAPAYGGPVPPSPTTEASSKPRRKYSLLAAFGLKSKGKEDAKRVPSSSHQAAAAQPVPVASRTPSNKSESQRSPAHRIPSRTPSYQQVPVIPRTSSGSHPSVHQIFQHPTPPGSQTHVYPPQGYAYGYQQHLVAHPYSPPQSNPSSVTPSRATSPRAVHRKAPPPIHGYPPQQNPSAPSLHSVGSLQTNGQPAPSIHASLASGSLSSGPSNGIASPPTGSMSVLQLSQNRSKPDVCSASGHGHESKDDARSPESRTPHAPPSVPRPPQSEADEDQRLSRMALLQPRQPVVQPEPKQAQAQAHSSPPPTHSLDVPQDVDREKRTPSPAIGPSQNAREHDQHTEVPVRGQPRIFAAMGTEDPEGEEAQAAARKLGEQWEHETPLVRGKPRIFVAQEEGELVGTEPAAVARQDGGGGAYTQDGGAYTQPAGAYVSQEKDAYTQPAQPEKEAEVVKDDGIVRDYPHTHGYPTPRSRSPVLPTERTVPPEEDEDARGRQRSTGSPPKDGHRISRSLPPTPSPRAPSPEPQHDTDGEREKEGSQVPRRLRKGGKRRGSSSQSDSEDDGRRHGHHFGLHLRGLGIFGVKALTEKQVEKLGTKEPQATGHASASVSPEGAPPPIEGANVQRRGSESDGRRKLRKEGRRGRREERDEDAGFVHVDGSAVQEEMQRGRPGPGAPPTPVSPEDYARARAHRRGAKLGKGLPAMLAPAQSEAQEPKKPSKPYPLVKHLLEPALLAGLLVYLDFKEWLVVARLNSQVREEVGKQRALTECVLEKFLGVVGYARWTWGLDPSLAKGKNKAKLSEAAQDKDKDKQKLPNDGEPLTLTLQDLNNYMRGVSTPSYQFSILASEYLRARGDPNQVALMGELAACCRAYTRIVLRLRAQAEAEARNPSSAPVAASQAPSSPPSRRAPSLQRGTSRGSSRAPSVSPSYTATISLPVRAAQSPLFRLRRAPLLQVFVPSPEGDWLSDESVVTCEEELKKAGVSHLMRAGDVVWDVAVGDEGNIGRLVWDGAYLIDLDFTWSRIGDLPKYLPTLAFPPSYFHRVIRTQGSGNPICHIDIAPWGEEVAEHLQLLQDRTRTETPQGSHHMVVRWVHRSSFTISPPAPNKPVRIPPMPNVGPGPSHGSWLVDPGWYGRVVVEAEGTNEGLADLQARCGRAFPPRAVGARASGEKVGEERNMVFRILRERSRPGEIWIRTVRDKERLR